MGISGMGSSKIVLGARYYQNTSDELFDLNFNGLIDEVRIWDGSRNITLIQESMTHSLRGNEPGLKAYFPFEDYRLNDPSKPTSTLLNLTTDTNGIADTCRIINNANFSNDAAPIQLALPKKDIPFTFNVKGSQLIINPKIELSRIENTNLSFSVYGIYDLHANRMKSPVNWNAFVKRNQLVWENNNIQLNCTPDKLPEFSLKIMNNGGSVQNWQLNDLPAWLHADYSSGTLNALSSFVIHFKIDPALNIGQYSAELNLSSSIEFNERCTINLSIMENDPIWQFDESQYENSMSLICQLYIAGNLSTDVNDMVGAFVGGECRGASKIELIQSKGAYLLNLTVFGNENENVPVQLMVWDASKGNLYTNVGTYTFDHTQMNLEFNANAILGSPLEPIQIMTTDSIGVKIPIKAGWNWLSFNLASSQLKNSNQLFNELRSSTGDLVKSGSGKFDQYVNLLDWDGLLTIDGYQLNEMYKLKNSFADTIQLSGVPIMTNDHPVIIRKGWNWIGYTPQYRMSVKSAFSYHTPLQGDLVKSQSQFAMYDQYLGWIGSLSYMKPFAGYMYFSKGDATVSFIYPQASILSRVKSQDESVSDKSVLIDAKNESSMTVLAELRLGELRNERSDLILRVFSEETHLTDVTAVNAGDHIVYPINISDEISGSRMMDSLHFEIYDPGTGNVRNSKLKLNFIQDKILGDISQPYIIPFDAINDGLEIFPNPFSEKLNIRNIPEGVKSIQFSDLQGRVIKSWNIQDEKHIQWDLSTQSKKLIDGVYMLNLIGNGAVKSVMVIHK